MKGQAAKQRYEMVARATNDAIYEWDISDTIYWNEGYETLGHRKPTL
jgi:PAS domain-containing protein